MTRVLIVGAGDIARRLFPLLAAKYQVFALVRSAQNAADWRRLGARTVLGDLDQRQQLQRIAGLADWVIHLAPPNPDGPSDIRTRHLLAALCGGSRLPQRLIYISTTGVYGDHAGAWINESTPPRASSARALRRADAEQQVRQFGRRTGCRVSILRVPGIYADDRLPLDRLRQGAVALLPDDDAYSNHIHADDLAASIVAAIRKAQANRTYNVIDDSDLKMGDYFDTVADAAQLPRPTRLPASEVRKKVSAAMWSYMVESRRISNHRLKHELHVRLRYPTVADAMQPTPTSQTSLTGASCRT